MNLHTSKGPKVSDMSNKSGSGTDILLFLTRRIVIASLSAVYGEYVRVSSSAFLH